MVKIMTSRAAGSLIIFVVILTLLALPVEESYASTMWVGDAYNEIMALNASGVGKVAAAGAAAGLGIWVARALLGVSAVGGVISIGMTVYDLVNANSDRTVLNVSVPANSAGVAAVPPDTTGANCTPVSNYWGSQAATDVLVQGAQQSVVLGASCNGSYYNLYSTCTNPGGGTWYPSTYCPVGVTYSGSVPAGAVILGGYSYTFRYVDGCGTCRANGTATHVYVIVPPDISQVPAGTVTTTPSVSADPAENRQAIANLLQQSLVKLDTIAASSQQSTNSMRAAIVAAIAAIQPISVTTTDYTMIGGMPAGQATNGSDVNTKPSTTTSVTNPTSTQTVVGDKPVSSSNPLPVTDPAMDNPTMPGSTSTPSYDTSFTTPNKKDIGGLVTSFLSGNPIVSAMNGTTVQLMGATCSVPGPVLFGKATSLNWCWMGQYLTQFGTLFVAFAGLAAAFIIFRRD